MKKVYIIAVASLLLGGCNSNENSGEENGEEANGEPVELSIMAAASLTDAVNEIQELYQEEENVEFLTNYGSSGQLRQQIMQGAPADLFLSASLSDMEELDSDGAVAESTDLLQNQLTLIATPDAADALNEWGDLPEADLQGIAMGEPEAVPAGSYALEALQNLDMWDSVEDNIINGSDVRQVLTYVETGNTDAGLVYQTDALTSDDIEVVDNAPEESHEPILYPIGLLTETDEEQAARDFYEFLQTEEALDIFEAYGFEGVE
ncbi:molybdate ABC transporter substrate-binding protein [Salicibibacter cibi]|uniref:Molybdate ABC transporter substrate-binding protein n=1 Tax=Salicibibacter cibi TaxID=2743001 RepID=A0A7T6Z8F8_9BACI|nr:molybdate ABC transporter substrate-binding protein [Salicibibacter cibi]QQK78803.1 molybdate ABC transporter substrate-binding protein [Salicibibacter cibi]